MDAGEGLGEGFTPAVREAWATVYDLVATTMQQAAASQKIGVAA